MATKITKTVVDATKPVDKTKFVWDIEIKGFGLRVLPTGVKSYVFQYRTPEGKSRRATIGKHGGTLTGFYPVSTDGSKKVENSKSFFATRRRIRGLWNRSM